MVGPAAVDRLAAVATRGEKDDDVATATAAYHSQSFHCGCEVVAEAQGCHLRAWEDCDLDLEDTLGRSRYRRLKAARTYPSIAVAVS